MTMIKTAARKLDKKTADHYGHQVGKPKPQRSWVRNLGNKALWENLWFPLQNKMQSYSGLSHHEKGAQPKYEKGRGFVHPTPAGLQNVPQTANSMLRLIIHSLLDYSDLQ